MLDFLNELNEGQRNAVLYGDGPSLVIAGAGSGKTRVLTYKIAYLMEQGMDPWNILALTFTNKAAREMKERIARQVGERRAQYLWMGTFHSIFLRILHAESEALGFSNHFTIYDTADSKSLLRSIIKEMGLDEKVYKPATVQSRISNAKNRLVTPARYGANAEVYEADCAARIPQVCDIYQHYWNRLKQADAMDFDDLLLYTYILFKEHPDILAKYQDRFKYILVDEYQDTNYAQHSIVMQLGLQHGKVCVVGDDAQSIYSFRGAEIDNILNFTKTFRGAKIFKLEQNYRSTQTIVQAANSLIEKNMSRIPKEVFSKNEAGEALGIYQAYSDAEEAVIVANKIKELHRKEGLPYSDFAILYRTNAQSRVFEEEFRKQSLPYRVYGGLSFYQRKEIKDIIAYFRLVVNPNDEEAFKRIVNYPARGIGDTTVGKIAAKATQHAVSLWEVICHPDTYALDVSKGTLTKLKGFQELMAGFIDEATERNAYELGVSIIKASGIIEEVASENTPEAMSKKENIEELTNGLKDFTEGRLEEDNPHISLSDYLSEVSLLTDQDSDTEDDGARITIMTVHSAKGLEFGTVFVVGLEENLFPSPMAGDSMRALEEERRLFYVAITRAEKHCYLTFAKMRFRYGKMEFSQPSRFLRDIDVRFVKPQQNNDVMPRQKAAPFGSQWGESSAPRFTPRSSDYGQPRRSFTTEERPTPRPVVTPVTRNLKRVSSVAPSAGSGSTAALQVGQQIQHERFGIGEVIKVEGNGDNAKATIQFRNAGTKQLLLRFARFKVL
ncbi:MAG: 3'-5' exonuclease [Bacteroidales bacterium]|nr:3'-5' exonuclease [Bacteroidales bacterium]